MHVVLWQGYVRNSMLFMNNSFWLLGLVSLCMPKISEVSVPNGTPNYELHLFCKSSTLASMLHSIRNSSMIMRYRNYNYYLVTSNLILHYSPNRSGAWRWAFLSTERDGDEKLYCIGGKYLVELVLALHGHGIFFRGGAGPHFSSRRGRDFSA